MLPRRMPRAAFGALAAILLCLAGFQAAKADESGAPARLLQQFGLAGADLGYVLVDLGSGKVLAAENADGLFLPASVTKLVTAYAALQILGPGHRFTTALLSAGDKLYLKGGGDPLLTSNELQSLAGQLKASGFLPAGFFYDDALLGSVPEISDSQPFAAEYNSGVGALTLDFNRIEVEWTRPTAGAAPVFRVLSLADGLDLPANWIEFAPTAEVLPPGALFLYAGDGRADRWLYAANLPQHGVALLPVKGTALQTALIFSQLAAMQGLRLPNPAPGRAPEDASQLGFMESPSLAEIIPGLMRYSNNSTAELIGLAASRTLTGKFLPPGASSAAVTRWLEARLPAADWDGFDFENHSGLSPKSRVSPRQMAAILGLVATDSDLVQSLPPLDDQARPEITDDPSRPRRAQAKSGTMDYATALAGFLPSKNGQRLAFAIFVFDRAKRAAFDRAMDRRVAEPSPVALAWTERARALEAALLKSWLAAF
jgi:serine-type D-Ala-D-Ala carboxypeptidase/endopeptidase (penicillin-binding protein 4)